MRYRAALIGCGKIGSEFADDAGAADAGVCTHAGAYVACPETDLVAVSDTNPARAERCARRWKVPFRYTDPSRLMAEQRPDIVSICTPDETHYDIVRTALLTDGVKGVLAEKPLATSLTHAKELVRLALARGIVLAVNYSRRYADNHVRLRDAIATGGLGTVRVVRGLYTKGTAHNGTHWFDLARFLVGDVAVVRAVDRLGEGGVDPTLDVQLQFTGGAVGKLLACRTEDFTVFEMEFLGSRGRIRVLESGSVIERYEVVEGRPFAGYRSLTLADRTVGGLRDVLLNVVRDLVRCLQFGTAPGCSGADAVVALSIADAARISAATNRPVILNDEWPIHVL